jgi:hypothetical protein
MATKALQLAAGVFLVYKLRAVETAFNESRFIGAVIYNCAIMGAVAIAAVDGGLSLSLAAQSVVAALGLLTGSFVSVLILFVPKLFHVAAELRQTEASAPTPATLKARAGSRGGGPDSANGGAGGGGAEAEVVRALRRLGAGGVSEREKRAAVEKLQAEVEAKVRGAGASARTRRSTSFCAHAASATSLSQSCAYPLSSPSPGLTPARPQVKELQNKLKGRERFMDDANKAIRELEEVIANRCNDMDYVASLAGLAAAVDSSSEEGRPAGAAASTRSASGSRAATGGSSRTSRTSRSGGGGGGAGRGGAAAAAAAAYRARAPSVLAAAAVEALRPALSAVGVMSPAAPDAGEPGGGGGLELAAIAEEGGAEDGGGGGVSVSDHASFANPLSLAGRGAAGAPELATGRAARGSAGGGGGGGGGEGPGPRAQLQAALEQGVVHLQLGRSGGAEGGAAAPPASLPAGWCAANDPTSKAVYYFHAASGTSQWHLPVSS